MACSCPEAHIGLVEAWLSLTVPGSDSYSFALYDLHVTLANGFLSMPVCYIRILYYIKGKNNPDNAKFPEIHNEFVS